MKTLFTSDNRLYYLDWLRVLAFSILLFEHCAELFVPWNFWVKNAEVSSALGYVITFLKPWRMPLLFMVSGAAVFLACKRKSSMEILKERSIRILLPLVGAMFLVIPPQIYFIRIQEGYQGNFWQFYWSVFDFSWFPQGNLHWLHLWYLGFIFGFTLLVIPFLPKMKNEKVNRFLNRLDIGLKHPLLLITLGLLMSLPYYFINSTITKGNLAQLSFYFPYFLFGLTVFLRTHIQENVKQHAKAYLILAICTTGALYALSFVRYDGVLLVKQAVNDQHKPFGIFALQTLNTWLSVLAILGYAIKFLNFKSRKLTYANEAVYPFYILHQTVIVAIGYYIVQMDTSLPWKLLLVTILSFGSIWVFYESVIKRFKLFSLLFGLKSKVKQDTVPENDLLVTSELATQNTPLNLEEVPPLLPDIKPNEMTI